MNKITLIGNLGRDPEMNYTPNGVAVTKFSLAVNRVTRSSTGEKEKETDWFNIVAWRQLAEICNNYLHKGDKVYIDGRLQQRKYTDKMGVKGLQSIVLVIDMRWSALSRPRTGGSQTF